MSKKNIYSRGVGLLVYIVNAVSSIRRGGAKLIIKTGLVTVNGKVITNDKHPVLPGDVVRIKGRVV